MFWIFKIILILLLYLLLLVRWDWGEKALNRVSSLLI